MEWPDEQALREIRERAQLAASRLRLPFRNRSWRGSGGNWQGAGIGNSIDFQDHRQYMSGDDPRHIDWQAYARTGHYSMKLYREEVSPRVDLVLDVSDSMALNAAKRNRSLELFHFTLESALRSAATVRCFAVSEAGCVQWPVESVVAGSPPPELLTSDHGGILLVPWRTGSLRVWITDLLFPGEPEPILAAMSVGKGRGLILSVHCEAECRPDWEGNIEFIDCETSATRSQSVPPSVLREYLAAYARHFSLWHDQANRHGVVISRVAAEPEFTEALRTEAAMDGAVEWVA